MDAQERPITYRIAVGPMRGRLKRVFSIDIETCGECGGDVKIIASIEDPAVILNNFYSDGRLSYRSNSLKGEYAIDLNLDTELPAVVAAVLGSFKNYLTESKYIQAYDNIRESAIEDIGARPEYYLSLIQHGLHSAMPEQIIAMGNGSASLRSGSTAGEWQLQLRLDPGWHVNATTVLDENLTPLQIQSSNSNSISVDAPKGKLLEMEFSDTPLNIYSGLTSDCG